MRKKSIRRSTTRTQVLQTSSTRNRIARIRQTIRRIETPQIIFTQHPPRSTRYAKSLQIRKQIPTRRDIQRHRRVDAGPKTLTHRDTHPHCRDRAARRTAIIQSGKGGINHGKYKPTRSKEKC